MYGLLLWSPIPFPFSSTWQFHNSNDSSNKLINYSFHLNKNSLPVSRLSRSERNGSWGDAPGLLRHDELLVLALRAALSGKCKFCLSFAVVRGLQGHDISQINMWRCFSTHLVVISHLVGRGVRMQSSILRGGQAICGGRGKGLVRPSQCSI